MRLGTGRLVLMFFWYNLPYQYEIFTVKPAYIKFDMNLFTAILKPKFKVAYYLQFQSSSQLVLYFWLLTEKKAFSTNYFHHQVLAHHGYVQCLSYTFTASTGRIPIFFRFHHPKISSKTLDENMPRMRPNNWSICGRKKIFLEGLLAGLLWNGSRRTLARVRGSRHGILDSYSRLLWWGR